MEKHESGIEFIVDKVEGNHYLIRDMSKRIYFLPMMVLSFAVERSTGWKIGLLWQSKFHWFMEDVGTVAN